MDIENVRETNILNNVRIMKIYISFLIENISPPLGSGYLRYKTIFCHKVDLDVQLMKFFIWRKNKVSLSRYLHFCIFVKSTDFKICGVITGIAT